jgi:hypothetical protein
MHDELPEVGVSGTKTISFRFFGERLFEETLLPRPKHRFCQFGQSMLDIFPGARMLKCWQEATIPIRTRQTVGGTDHL